MSLGYIPIAVSVAAFLISVLMAKFAYREQKLRLRPQIFIESIEGTSFTESSMILSIKVKNVGIIIAKNVVISHVIQINSNETSLGGDEHPSKALVVPNQTLVNMPIISGQTFIDIFNSRTPVYLIVRVDYEFGNNKYYYKLRNEFDIIGSRWAILDGDAN